MPHHLDPLTRPRGKQGLVDDGPVTSVVVSEKMNRTTTAPLNSNAATSRSQLINDQSFGVNSNISLVAMTANML